MAFQVTDDLLDYTADESMLGKPVLKDLQEGNVTLPVIELMKSASQKQQHFLREVVQTRQFSDENKKRIIDLVNDYGCIDKSKKLARKFTDEARNSLNGFPDSEYKRALLDLPELVLNRSK
jgi:geranylgeranyl pyrophosphate synthase